MHTHLPVEVDQRQTHVVIKLHYKKTPKKLWKCFRVFVVAVFLP